MHKLEIHHEQVIISRGYKPTYDQGLYICIELILIVIIILITPTRPYRPWGQVPYLGKKDLENHVLQAVVSSVKLRSNHLIINQQKLQGKAVRLSHQDFTAWTSLKWVKIAIRGQQYFAQKILQFHKIWCVHLLTFKETIVVLLSQFPFWSIWWIHFVTILVSHIKCTELVVWTLKLIHYNKLVLQGGHRVFLLRVQTDLHHCQLYQADILQLNLKQLTIASHD